MHILVVYDISEDRERGRIAELCLDFGLQRIQESVFIGMLNKRLRNMITRELKNKLPRGVFDVKVFQIDGSSEGRYIFSESRLPS